MRTHGSSLQDTKVTKGNSKEVNNVPKNGNLEMEAYTNANWEEIEMIESQPLDTLL